MTRALPQQRKKKGRIQATQHAAAMVYMGPAAHTPLPFEKQVKGRTELMHSNAQEPIPTGECCSPTANVLSPISSSPGDESFECFGAYR